MKNQLFSLFLFLIGPLPIFSGQVSILAQTPTILTWWKPSDSKFSVVEGQMWSNEMHDSLHRLPPRAEPLVRKAVWNLARQSAGLSIRFISNAPQIIVRYKVSGNIAMNHMPATGVSGVDLYANAYEKKLREIMHEPKGTLVTQIPTRHNREPAPAASP